MSTDESILFANNLIYDAPAASSVTTNRVLKRQQFQNRNYSEGQTATCTLNTGTDFIDSYRTLGDAVARVRRERKPAMQAMALRREVFLHLRRGEQAQAMKKARAALAAAPPSPQISTAATDTAATLSSRGAASWPLS